MNIEVLQENLIKHLQADGYELVSIPDVEALEANFRKQINKHNAVELGGRKLTDKEFKDRIICGVDLGINNDATLSVMDSNGTILGRHFVNTNDKDFLK